VFRSSPTGDDGTLKILDGTIQVILQLRLLFGDDIAIGSGKCGVASTRRADRVYHRGGATNGNVVYAGVVAGEDDEQKVLPKTIFRNFEWTQRVRCL